MIALSLRARGFSSILLALALAAGAFPRDARAGFEKMVGSFTGGFDGTGTYQVPGGAPTQQDFPGAISGDVKAQSLGKTGSFLFVTVSATGDPSLVKFNFKSHGRMTATAIVPGMINVPATGKWKSSGGGTTVHFTLSATAPLGIYTANGTLKTNGKSLGLKIAAYSGIYSSTALNSAQFLFIGDRDKEK